MFSLNRVRESFLKFFERKGFGIAKSSSVVPDNDPTLLFTNAGMVQFKDCYTGLQKPPFKKIVTSQKCIRAGGKHNDLDNVGYTARHHTFFEMLGNFSFGDLTKKEMIQLAWEYLTEEIKLPREKLLVTVYYKDEEVYNIWKNDIGLKEKDIIKLDEENFWSMGDTGPCGTCTEIFYDHGEEIEGGRPGTENEDGDRYIEIWDIVFTHFDKQPDGTLKDLGRQCIDTGIGLERLTAILQGVHNNYEIDLFKKLIDNSKNIIGDGNIFYHRIIADHLRSSAFLIADGVLPSNEGRGYVLRRIMRRAMLQIHKLGCKTAVMYKLVPCLVNLMGDSFPELSERENFIMETIKTEEEKFISTLDKGLKILEEKTKNLKNGDVLEGTVAFELYDTYGFPLDLTEQILRDKNITIDREEFEKEMTAQKQRAKANWSGSGDVKTKEIYLKLKQKTIFEGYDNYSTSGAKILNIIKNNEFVEMANENDEVEIVLDKTCCYGEFGGQVGDDGVMLLVNEDNSITLPFTAFEILDTLKTPNLVHIHRGKVVSGCFRVGNFVNVSINRERRKKITANHSATHLLQDALRRILGDTVLQKGSHIDDKSLRFDVSYNGVIGEENLRKAEEIVNGVIVENTATETIITTLDEAKKIGAIALFNEKYGDEVRVVKMGKIKNKNNKTIEQKQQYQIEDVLQHLAPSKNEETFMSIELCGGTHVKRTGDIGCFKIIKEESIASGVRRIEAITGGEVLKFINGKLDILNSVNTVLRSNDNNILEKVENLQKENKELLKTIENNKKEQLKNINFQLKKNNDMDIYYETFDNISAGEFKPVFIQKLNNIYKTNTVMLAVCHSEGKNTIIIGTTKDLTDRINLSNIFKQLNIKGGGQSNLFMGSANGEIKVDDIIDVIIDIK